MESRHKIRQSAPQRRRGVVRRLHEELGGLGGKTAEQLRGKTNGVHGPKRYHMQYSGDVEVVGGDTVERE